MPSFLQLRMPLTTSLKLPGALVSFSWISAVEPWSEGPISVTPAFFSSRQ